MKKIFYTLVLCFISISVLAQAPQSFNYQAVLRDDAGEPMVSESVTVDIEILQGRATGSAVFNETHNTETNEFGLINLQIGSEQSLDAVDWGADDYFIEVSVDGTSMGTTQLLSVPYALHAMSAVETDPMFEAWDKSEGIVITESQISDLQEYLTEEVDPTFEASPASDITTENISNWDEAYDWGDHSEAGYLTDVAKKIIPRIAQKEQKLSVSFSGGDELSFSQATPTCPDLHANAKLRFTQGTPTIYPEDRYFIDSTRFDLFFYIPSWAPSGLYDIIISPDTDCPHEIDESFKIIE